jgi:hypothetical protein
MQVDIGASGDQERGQDNVVPAFHCLESDNLKGFMQGDSSLSVPREGAELQFQHGVLPNCPLFSAGSFLRDATFSDYVHLLKQQAEASPMYQPT